MQPHWVEPTNRAVAVETARFTLLGWPPRRQTLAILIATIVALVLTLPSVDRFDYEWYWGGAFYGAWIGTTWRMARRQHVLGRPATRSVTAAATVTAIYVLGLGSAILASSFIGPEPDDALLLRAFDGLGFEAATLAYVLFLGVLMVELVRSRSIRRRYQEELGALAAAERALRAAAQPMHL
jgi:hypothetical protein